jgi:hypothetical protein
VSLTNDAPKRAKKSPGGPPLPAAESELYGGSGWLLPLLVILILVAACFFIGLVMARRTVTRIANRPEPSATQQVESVSAPGSDAPPMVSETNMAAGSNSIPMLPPSPFKLQGIVYNPTRPWAIMDGKTVYPGSRVDSFLVKEISKDAVTLEGADGSRQKLFLGR